MTRRAVRRSIPVLAALALVAACSSGGASPKSEPSTTKPAPTSSTLAPFHAKVAASPLEYPAQPDGVPWPTKRWATGQPEGVDPALVQAELDRDFGELSSPPGNTTDAVVVVQHGRIVAERYRPGFGPDTAHASWSMAKSVTQALAGILVGQGRLDIYRPAPVPAWSDPADPRHAITTDELLRMASGLQWKEDYFVPDSDTIAMLSGPGKDDMAGYAAAKPLEVPPGSRVQYATGTANIVAGVIGSVVGTGAPYHRFVDDELLRPIGIDPARAKPGWDGSGVLVGGSVFDLTARDFVRFGLLYLRGGRWDGRWVVPDGWVDYARTPTPAPAGTGEYGASWWTYKDCPGGFRAGGFAGQHLVICPTLDLVVLVLSNRMDGKDGLVRDDLVHLFRDGRPGT